MKHDTDRPYRKVKPLLVDMLQMLNLDDEFTSAEGSIMINSNNEKITDFIGGYGACLLGHNHPDVKAYARQLLERNVPVHAQMSLRNKAGKLASELEEEARTLTGKKYVTTFASTGAEAVEIAIKIAQFRCRSKINAFLDKVEYDLTLLHGIDPENIVLPNDWNCRNLEELAEAIRKSNRDQLSNFQPKMVAATRGFHGKTTGALSLTHNPKFREGFTGGTSANIFIDPDQMDTVPACIESESFKLFRPILINNRVVVQSRIFTNVIGVIVEPVQGEGGIHEIPDETLQKLRAITLQSDVLLIFDEIQCGFFRTGQFLTTKIAADIHLLGKQLGGGIAKISAVMAEDSIYPQDFSLLHTSTFAEDEFSSMLSSRALQLTKQLAPIVKEKGHIIKTRLTELAKEFPDVIQEVRGKGLLIGIEFKDHSFSQNYSFQFMFRSGYFNYMVCSYLLNNHNVRVGSSLSSSNVVRIEPSALISPNQIDQLLAAMHDLCLVLDRQDMYCFVRHLLPEHDPLRTEPLTFSKGTVPMSCSSDQIQKVGFITHFISPDTVRASDPSLQELDDDMIHALLDKIMVVGKPIIAGSQVIKSSEGETIELFIAGCCFTSRMAKEALIQKSTGPYIGMIQNALDLLVNTFGVKYTGLGQYTSILTHNGKLLKTSSSFITTGNSFTTFLGIESLLNRCIENDIKVSDEQVAVIGAGGNIASVFADCFSTFTRRLVLIGSGRQHDPKLTNARDRIIYNSFTRYLDGTGHGELDDLLHKTDTFRKFRDREVESNTIVHELLLELGSEFPVQVAETLDAVKGCRIVIAATNASAPFIRPEHLSDNAIVCDIAVPMNSTRELLENNRGIQIIQGGLARLPEADEIVVKGFPLPAGVIFGCLAETLIAGYSDVEVNFSLGRITAERVQKIGELGKRNGITFNTLKNVSAL